MPRIIDKKPDSVVPVLCFIFTVIMCSFLPTQVTQSADWLQFGRDGRNTRGQPGEMTIHAGNVSDLKIKWTYQAMASIVKTPAVESDGFIYFADVTQFPSKPNFMDNSSFVYKLDKNGNEIWKKNISQVVGQCLNNPNQPLYQVVTAPAIKGNKVLIGTSPFSAPLAGLAPQVPGGYFVTMNKNTGACETATVVTDPTHLYEGVFSSPSVQGNIAYMGISSNEEEAAGFIPGPCCTTQGSVAAVNIVTGQLLWRTQMIDSNLTGYSGATPWGSAPALYPEGNLLVVTTGNAYTRGTTEPDSVDPMMLPVNSFVGLDMTTGEKRWVYRVVPDDFWNVSCFPGFGNDACFDNDESTVCNCPDDQGPDYDFGAGCTLVKNLKNPYGIDSDDDGKVDKKLDACIAVNKEGSVHAVEVNTGKHIWSTKIGPTTLLGLAGTCYDGKRIYATQVDAFDASPSGVSPRTWSLVGGPNDGDTSYGGTLSALDIDTGGIIWQNADPVSLTPPPPLPPPFTGLLETFGTAPYLAPPTCIGTGDGVVFASSVVPNELITLFGIPFPPPAAPNMFAFDAVTGEYLTGLKADSPVISGPAVVDGQVYWGDGLFMTAGKLYSLGLP